MVIYQQGKDLESIYPEGVVFPQPRVAAQRLPWATGRPNAMHALKGKDLIALYGFEEAGKITAITHAARKDKGEELWTNKMGTNSLIGHEFLKQLGPDEKGNGGTYGRPIAIYAKLGR